MLIFERPLAVLKRRRRVFFRSNVTNNSNFRTNAVKIVWCVIQQLGLHADNENIWIHGMEFFNHETGKEDMFIDSTFMPNVQTCLHVFLWITEFYIFELPLLYFTNQRDDHKDLSELRVTRNQRAEKGNPGVAHRYLLWDSYQVNQRKHTYGAVVLSFIQIISMSFLYNATYDLLYSVYVRCFCETYIL